jgi:hypothetical protein
MEWIVGIGFFVVILFAFPRKTLILLSILIVISAIGGGGYFLYEYLEQRKYDAFKMSAVFDLEACPKSHPLLITVKNETGSTVEKVSFSITGKRDGFSTPVYESVRYGSGARRFETDKIFEPNSVYTICWVAPPLRAGSPVSDKDRFPAETMVWTIPFVRPQFPD